MVNSIDIRERERRRAYGEVYPDVRYYLTASKLFIYSTRPGENSPRITFAKSQHGYNHPRKHCTSINECLKWARSQPEMKGPLLPSK